MKLVRVPILTLPCADIEARVKRAMFVKEIFPLDHSQIIKFIQTGLTDYKFLRVVNYLWTSNLY